MGVEAFTFLVRSLVGVAADNAVWMTWNLLLAFIPAALAVVVFRHRGPRTVLWWLGVALCVLFLPNAPYVVTDLVHLRADVVRADSDLAVITAVLPVYTGFIALGLVAYVLVLGEMGRYLARLGLGRWRVPAEMAAHAMCAVGVVLGRMARLNSWEPMTEPQGTLERVILTLTWRGAPFVVLATFAVIWLCHGATRALVRSGLGSVGTLVRHMQRLAALRGPSGAA